MSKLKAFLSYTIVVFHIFLGVCACTAEITSSKTMDAHGQTLVTIHEIYDGAFDNHVVNVAGFYMGWTSCNMQKNKTLMVTRSDWVLAADSMCIFVTGGIPRSVTSPFQGEQSQKVCIKARVKKVNNKYVLLYIGECANVP